MEASPPPFFKRGPSPAFRLGVFALLSIAFMAIDTRFKYLEPARQAVSIVLYPLQQIAAGPGAIVGRISGYFSDQATIKSDNARLKEETLRQAVRLEEQEALRRENTELRALLQARARVSQDTLAAEVLYGARDPFSRKLVIDKGSSNDVQPGGAVVDEAGVIGQVTRVYPFLSEVTLITDKNQAVPVQNLRSGGRAIVFGNGREGTLDMRYMPVNADVQVGDTLVTSGIDGIYPEGLPVARVSSVERNAARAFARITCAPLSGVDRRAHVLVITAKRDLPQRPADEPPPAEKRRKSRRGGA